MQILPPFHLILTSGPVLLAKICQKIVFHQRMFPRWIFGVCSLRVLAKTWAIPNGLLRLIRVKIIARGSLVGFWGFRKLPLD